MELVGNMERRRYIRQAATATATTPVAVTPRNRPLPRWTPCSRWQVEQSKSPRKKTSSSVAVTGWLGDLLKDLCATTIQQLTMVSVVDTSRLVVLGVLYKTADYYPLTGVLVSVLYKTADYYLLTGVLVSVLYTTADYYPLAKKVLPLLRW